MVPTTACSLRTLIRPMPMPTGGSPFSTRRRFQTSSSLGEVQARTGQEVVCVFVPTTPNPTSGFFLIVPRSEVIELEMSIEEAVRLIMSMGVIVPQAKAEELADKWAAPGSS